MANWKLIGGIAGGLIVVGAIGNAVNGDGTNTAAPTPSYTTTTAATPAPAVADDKPDKVEAETKTVPQFVGMGLQSAQDTAQAAGFYGLKSHDSLGRARHQILDRDWKVCSQNVRANSSASTDKVLDFGAVKLEETCPAHDEPAPSAAGGTMPSFNGKSVAAARDALDSGTSFTVEDASGQDRFILIESNWKVCSQEPAPGAKVNGQPVNLKAVKFEEECR
ncbi:PASTA domain-containing protein [Streptomyces sp. NRRL F-2799]|uniref:PASTA domain-containing protein n=1 Tax=Streptomyces sp. NRRL F-2799 TaxID=1463844 RepID=UPI000B1E1A82|nr:PASTA domain-containing protein [Streptomyces sp. NRRL F-2799]